MAGYTRQSTASIINGSPITAPPLNAEFNQVAAAFNPSTGHSHDGTSGNSPKINLATSVSGYLPAEHGGIGGANKMDATTAPLVTNDNTEGYAPGSLWENTTNGRIYICVGSATGAAVWRELVQVITDNVIKPITTNTVDLGTNTERFQDLFLSGGIAASGNATLGGTLNVTGNSTLGGTLAVTGNVTASGNATVTGTLGVTGDTTVNNLTVSGTNSVNSASISSGSVDGTVIGNTTPAAGTFTTINANTSITAASATISGGSLDGATIGATTPSTGAFTTISASGTTTLATVDIGAGAIDGTVIGATSAAAGNFTTLSTTGAATIASADINGGSLDGATVGATTPSTGSFTTLAASGGVTGNLTGNVVGNVTGNVTGNVSGDLTGNVTGNVTSTGSSSFNNVTIDGTLNMNAGTTATIENLTDPTNAQDAATKAYVDSEISTLIGDAGAALDTLGELADALNDDDDFSTTVTNSIATKLPLAGGTMSGAIAMGTSKITGMGDPTAAQDAATKTYTDTQRDTRVAKSGDTMTGNLAMGSNNITGLATPTANDHASNKSYVDGLFQSTVAAATSATNAATSETNAATSETNAATSATAAASSATSAAASFDSFDDRYLGAKSSAPSTDNDGDALVTGALYFDSTAGAMKVYSGSGWTNAGSSVNGTSDRQTYTATANQTVFSATYDSGYVDVYLNGVKLLAGTDFTATNGTSITLASGASVNDIVDIVAYGTFVLADHLTETQSDAKYMPLAGGTLTGNTTISGTLTTDGLTVDDKVYLEGTNPYIVINDTDVTDLNTMLRTQSGVGYINTINDAYNAVTNRISLNHATGDISFYDTSGNAKLVWDASAESLGIGVAPQTQLTLQSTTPFIRLQDDQSTVSAGTNMGGIEFRTADSTVVGASRITGKIRVEGDGTFNASDKSPSRMIFSTHATSGTDPVDALTIDSNQNVGIPDGHLGVGTDAPSQFGSGVSTVYLKGTDTTNGRAGAITFAEYDGTNTGTIYSTDGNDGYGGLVLTSYQGDMKFSTNSLSNYNMVIKNNTGNVGIGTTAPSRLQYGSVDPKLHVKGTGTSGYTLAARFENGDDGGNDRGAAILVNHSNDRGMLIEGGRGTGDQGVGMLSVLNSGASRIELIRLTQAAGSATHGYVTTPNQPYFNVTKNGSSYSVANNATLVFNRVMSNVGSHYSSSTGRFTAPVTGKYLFIFQVIVNGNYNNASVRYYKNGSRFYGSDMHFSPYLSSNSYWDGVHNNQIVAMNANDYIEVVNVGPTVTYHGDHWSHFTGMLLG